MSLYERNQFNVLMRRYMYLKRTRDEKAATFTTFQQHELVALRWALNKLKLPEVARVRLVNRELSEPEPENEEVS